MAMVRIADKTIQRREADEMKSKRTAEQVGDSSVRKNQLGRQLNKKRSAEEPAQ